MAEENGTTDRRRRRLTGGARERSRPGPRANRGRGGVTDGRTRPSNPIQPDTLDRQIITLLRSDGRRSNREIARRLGVPEATVRYRVRRLTESGVLKITASVDPEHLGYALTAVISVQVEPPLMVSAAETIGAMPEVMWLAIAAGVSDLILTASFHNQEEMFEFIAERLSHVPGVSRTQTSVCMRVVKKTHEWATDLTTAITGDDLGEPVAFHDDDIDEAVAASDD